MKFATTVLVFCVAALVALGTVMLCSSPAGARYVTQQTIWAVLGVAACAAAASFDYRRYRKFSWAIYLVAIVLLAAVFLPQPIGIKANGARRWIDLQFASFQPSEFAKLALIIVVAHYAEFAQRKIRTLMKGFVFPAAIILPVLGLIFLEPDYGTTLLLAAVSAVMLIIAGVRLNVIVPVMVIGLVAVSISIANNENRLRRVMAFVKPNQYLEGTGFQQHQAAIALGSGGLTGVGLGDGRQKFGYVPENHTDFILSIIGEELGLVATLSVVLAFLAIVVVGIHIALRASDRFGMLLACGIVFLLGMQAFINIGVVTRVLPNKGLPLPFVSYGGSSLLMMLTCVGVLLSIARHALEPARESRGFNPFAPQMPSTSLS